MVSKQYISFLNSLVELFHDTFIYQKEGEYIHFLSHRFKLDFSEQKSQTFCNLELEVHSSIRTLLPMRSGG